MLYILNLPIIFTLSELEKEKFNKLVLHPKADLKNPAIIKLLLKELDNDPNKLIRILHIDYQNQEGIFYKIVYRKIIKLLKEAVILTSYEDFMEQDGFISIYTMSRLSRLQLIGVDRNTIIRTFKKYGINYPKKR